MTLPYFKVDTQNEHLKTLTSKHWALWEEFREKLDLSWIYHDHGLEGTVLQHREITVALNDKVLSDSSFMPMYQEIKNLHDAIHLVREYTLGRKRQEKITRAFLQQLYTCLSKKLRNLAKGDGLRQEDGRYGAYYHRSCAFTEVESRLKQVLFDVNQARIEEEHILVTAARFQHQFMQLMPFGRFSGKIARLVSNLLLMRHYYPPVIVHTVERARYYESFVADDETSLLLLLTDAINGTVDSAVHYVKSHAEERRRKREARRKRRTSTTTAAAKTRQKDKVATETKRKQVRRAALGK